jgi:phage-related protein
MAWTRADDFIAFSFGNFDSKEIGIYRTINNRHNIELAPPMQDITAEVPGGDGQYYFGTFHKPKIFNIDFAFDRLTESGLVTLKKAFMGKELKQLCFAERENAVYMAKVTGSPAIKVIPFDDENNETIYKGEGNIQFTAYWPYAKDKNSTIKTGTISSNSISFGLTNIGDLPTYIKITATNGNFSQVVLPDTTISGTEMTSWDSKTGIAKNAEEKLVPYSGYGLYQLPVDSNIDITIIGSARTKITIEYYQQYY